MIKIPSTSSRTSSSRQFAPDNTAPEDPTTRHTANTDPQLRTQDQRLARASDAPHAKPVAVHYQAKHILLGLVALLRRVVMGGERGTFGYVTLRSVKRYVTLRYERGTFGYSSVTTCLRRRGLV